MSPNHYSSTEKNLVKVNGKIIGSLEDSKFIKTVIGSKHKLRYPPAWAIDSDAFDNEVKPSATEIVVIDKETGINYHSSVDTFIHHAFRFNRGFGEQYALPIRFWQTDGNGHKQLTLWGGDSNG